MPRDMIRSAYERGKRRGMTDFMQIMHAEGLTVAIAPQDKGLGRTGSNSMGLREKLTLKI